jgi:UTP-glucose-1-phosphate uridylyltransferase
LEFLAAGGGRYLHSSIAREDVEGTWTQGEKYDVGTKKKYTTM